MEQQLVAFFMRARYLLAVASVVVTLLVGYGAQKLYFEADYKIYFLPTDPGLIAHEAMQDIYTKTDNLAIVMRPESGDFFNDRLLTLLYDITEQAWQTPYVMRVDSLTNHQHTSALEDDLLVEDLVLFPDMLDDAKIAQVKELALSKRQLVNRLISEDGTTSLINITLELPREVDPDADEATQAEQRLARSSSHTEVVSFGNEIISQVQQSHPDIEMHLAGNSVINDSFERSSKQDMTTLIPLMYVVILVLLAVFLRSVGAVVGSLLVIACASIVTFGAAGWYGYAINTVSVTAPMIVLTIAVCDAVHLMAMYLRGLSQQLPPEEAMSESLRQNLQPIFLTSVTTAIGFLSLNFASSPPFHELGNMTATGIMWAMVLTFTLLPALGTFLVRKRKPAVAENDRMVGLSKFIMTNQKWLLPTAVITALVLMAFLPANKINDDPFLYFKEGVPIRDSIEFSNQYLPGVRDISYSIACEDAACVSDPEFLAMLDEFVDWLEEQPDVSSVYSYIDVIKNLNKSMHGDDEAYHAVPDQRDLAAQYMLMYEMSLPYGLDLNDQLNLDKSSTMVRVMVNQSPTMEFIGLAERGQQWLQENHDELTGPAASVNLMFAQVGLSNISSMLWGALIAVIGITITILIALRSWRYALISIVPNTIPVLMAFGIWGIVSGDVNSAVAMVFSISLGILVDDTVHFISKYRRAREIKGLSKDDAVQYAFTIVGPALIVTTMVLVAGFLMLTLSDFNLNALTGALVSLTISIALIFDFIVLPPLLSRFEPKSDNPSALSA
ncbi:MAG: efflux RND transporter permease subunit [Pseudomonadota bacterium]